MLDTSRVASELEAVRAFADRSGLRAELEARLARLDRYAEPRRTRCTLYADAAPHSFTFVMELETRDGEWCVWFDGDLAYHGPPADSGTGTPAPRPVETGAGWSIHA